MTTRYVQRVGDGYRETVDEYPYNNREQRQEARRCLNEYRLADPTADYYLSRRPCRGWNEQEV